MKIRNSLVSNSSSSSFIVSYKLGEKCKCCGRSDPDLAQIIRDKADTNADYQIYAIGKLEIIKSLKGEYCDPDYDATIKKVVEEINTVKDDYTILYCSVSHHDSDMLERIESTGTILYRGEG